MSSTNSSERDELLERIRQGLERLLLSDLLSESEKLEIVSAAHRIIDQFENQE